MNTIEDRTDFAAFLRDLLANLRQEPGRWENCDLTSYLSAMAAWAEDMDGYYENRGDPVPKQPSWRTLGELLLAARVYE
ncbi:MAG: DUF7660 family protein [Dehalococcoidia bacterium]